MGDFPDLIVTLLAMFVNARLSSGPPRSEGQALHSSVKLSGLPGQLPDQPRGVRSLPL